MTSDRGSGSVLVLAMAALLALLGLLATTVGAVAVARHRAAAAADLAALAAADRALQGAGPACAAAARAAERAEAELAGCRLDGDVAQVVAVVRPDGPLGRLGAARAVARAGPGASGPVRTGTNQSQGASRL